METIKKIIIPIIITSFLAFLFNFITEYLALDKGSIEVGPPITLEGKKYIPLDICNYTVSSIDKLKLSIPKNIDLTKVISSEPIKVEETAATVGSERRKYIEISDILGNQLTRLLIPIADEENDFSIRVVNAKEMHLEDVAIKEIQNPVLKAFKKAIPYTVIVTILYSIMLYVLQLYEEREHKKLKAEMEKVEEQHEKVEAQYEKLEQKLEATENEAREKANELRKQALLLLARISDYCKENDFWRDTIRKIMYEAYGDKKRGEEVIHQVTESLKTYGTLNRDKCNFEAVKVLADMYLKKKAEHE
jgi:hypothetical protein